MLENLIEEGNEFNGHFTTAYRGGTIMGIDGSQQDKYLQWIGKLGVYCESKLKEKCPDMTNKVLSMVGSKSVVEKDYNLIMGYLKSNKELQNE